MLGNVSKRPLHSTSSPKSSTDHCSADQKLQLISAMWAVAYADGDLSKYEEHLIRQVADLTYVPHADYIHCKLAANE